jgi:XisH protein
MSARDALHETVRKALEKAGWTITADPLRVVYGSDVMLVDLGAERLIAENNTSRSPACAGDS